MGAEELDDLFPVNDGTVFWLTPGTIVSLDSVFGFGIHKGSKLRNIIVYYPDYITWMLRESLIELDEEAAKMIAEKGLDTHE